MTDTAFAPTPQEALDAPRSHGSHPFHPFHRAAQVVALGLWAYPALFVVALYLTWFAAWVVLGHRPLPNLDDPKFIGLLVDIPYAVAMVMLTAAPAAMLLGAWVVPIEVARRVGNGRPSRSVIVASIAMLALALTWAAAFLFLRADPWDVATWFLD